MEIFFDLNVALTKQRNSLGVGKGGLPSLGTGLLCPLTEGKILQINFIFLLYLKLIYINTYTF